jgi:hypothetical protein
MQLTGFAANQSQRRDVNDTASVMRGGTGKHVAYIANAAHLPMVATQRDSQCR